MPKRDRSQPLGSQFPDTLRAVHIRSLAVISLLIFVAGCMGSTGGEPGSGSTGNGAPAPDQSAASLSLREVLGPGHAASAGCWQAPRLPGGKRALLNPALCDINELRLARPVIFRRIADAEARTVGVPWAVEVTFRKADASRLKQYTTRMAADGEYVAMLMDQQLLSVSRVARRVTDGTLTIEGNFTMDEAMELQERLTGSARGA
jgi:hypothetical protein